MELREKQSKKKTDLLVRAGKFGLDGMPPNRPPGKWRHEDNSCSSWRHLEATARTGDGEQACIPSEVQHYNGPCHHDFDHPGGIQ